MKKTILSLTIALLAASAVHAQTTNLTPTTLSAAIANSKDVSMVVASATGFTAGTTVAYIDRELVSVKSVSGTTIGIIRGQAGTSAAIHASSANVFVWNPANVGPFFNGLPQGKCTRSAELYLPRIDLKSGTISDCLNSTWTAGDYIGGSGTSAKWRVLSPEPGGTAYTSLNTNGTTVGSTTMYCTEVFLATNKLLTGIALLNGTTVGADKQYVALFDAGGNLLANSALAGTVTAGTSVYQTRAFTSKFFAVGPAQYFGCFQSDTGTDSVRMAVTGVNDNILTKGTTGATFGTIPAFTVPTTFTTAVGPYIALY
jgi:hypothetical protein